MRRHFVVGLKIVASFVRRLIGFGLLGIAVVLLFFEIVALVDPVGTKLSDDGDPFGNPYQPWWVHAIWFLVISLIAWAGFRLDVFGRIGRDRAT